MIPSGGGDELHGLVDRRPLGERLRRFDPDASSCGQRRERLDAPHMGAR
jgi:hypothetical protein